MTRGDDQRIAEVRQRAKSVTNARPHTQTLIGAVWLGCESCSLTTTTELTLN